MKDVLVLYPHGLGDCILLTPALREFYNLTGNKLHVGILERFRTSKIFDHCPYVDNIFYTKDPWHDYGEENAQVGFPALYSEWKTYAEENKFGGIVMPMHSEPENKIILNFKYLGLKSAQNFQTEIFTTDTDKEEALTIIKQKTSADKFGFIQTHAGLKTKDLPENFGRKWLAKNKGLSNFIEIGKEIKPFDYNINVQFEVLRQSSAVCLTDSVFYHACHAINMPVDYAYFARGVGVYERVKPLHKVVENISYKIEEID